MFQNHISIKKMHETFPNIIPENFDFKEVSKDDVRKDIRNLNVESTFPEELEHSEVIPVYKKLDPLKKENYRPVSLLSKAFERIIYQQINICMKDKLSKCLRKSHGTQHLLVTMLEKRKKSS